MHEPLKAFNHGTKPIILEHNAIAARPTEIHYKSDGAVGDKPSFAIVMEPRIPHIKIVGELSLEMLNNALQEIGYEIKKQ